MNSSNEYWEINGVSLGQFGWNIETFGGQRYDVPAMRGDDVQFAYVPGEEFRPKLPAGRTISLAMWVIGADPATGIPAEDQRLAWNDNWAFLRRLFWTPNRQFDLTRRWYLTNPDTGLPEVSVATAQGQLASTIAPTMTRRSRAQFTVDIRLPDPFFYGEEIVTVIPAGGTVIVVNPGDYTAAHRHVWIRYTGAIGNPELVNQSATPDVSVRLGTTVTAGNATTLDIEQFSALSDTPEPNAVNGSLNRIGWITHAGARQWMGLLPGNNVLTLNGVSGGGYATVRFRPPYM